MVAQSERRAATRAGNVRVLAVVAVCSLVLAACGGHGRETGAPAVTSGGATTTTAAKSASGTEPKPGQFGTMDEAVCGPGDAKGSTDKGVTGDSIKIGTTADPGNTIIPGLLQELFDGSKAFVDWCNKAGGINGRKIDLTLRDTKIVEGQQRIAEACASDFMLVGGGSGLDGSLAKPRVACGLPQIPGLLTTDRNAVAAKLQVAPFFSSYPGYLAYGLIYRRAAQLFPEGIKKFAYLAGTEGTDKIPASVEVPKTLKKAHGFDTVYSGATPPPPATVDNWRPYIEPMKSGGAKVVEYQHIADQVATWMNNMSDVGFKPDAIINSSGAYSETFIKGNSALATIPTYVEVTTYPFEEAANQPPVQQFLDNMDASIPGWSKSPKSLAVQSWSAWLLFAKAAKSCGSNLTRDCVLKAAAATGKWDAGGVIAPGTISVGTPKGPFCSVIMRATPAGFKIDKKFTDPNQGIFNCDVANRVKTAD